MRKIRGVDRKAPLQIRFFFISSSLKEKIGRQWETSPRGRIYIKNVLSYIPYHYQFVSNFDNDTAQIDNYTVLKVYGMVLITIFITGNIPYRTEIIIYIFKFFNQKSTTNVYQTTKITIPITNMYQTTKIFIQKPNLFFIYELVGC